MEAKTVDNELDLESRLKGGLWGVVVGDAFGFPFQFWSRERMKAEYPNPRDVPMRGDSGAMIHH